MDDSAPQHQTAAKTGHKKPFEPPRLHVYGDISTLTRKVGQTGVADGGGGKNSKTRL
jgi:hypothetical protein